MPTIKDSIEEVSAPGDSNWIAVKCLFPNGHPSEGVDTEQELSALGAAYVSGMCELGNIDPADARVVTEIGEGTTVTTLILTGAEAIAVAGSQEGIS